MTIVAPAALVAQRLAEQLGSGKVFSDDALLTRYSHDSWPVQTKLDRLGEHPLRPDVVVRATATADIVTVLTFARASGIPVTARGLGSSVTGQPLPQSGGIVLDLSGLRGDPVINETNCTVTVGAGWNGGELEQILRTRGMTLGNSPQSLFRSTVGGWVATRETGQLSSRYGGIERTLLSVQVVLADASVVRLGANPRAAMGPDLTGLYIGSEGTLGIITEVTMRIDALPEWTIREAFRVPGLDAGLAIVRCIAQSGLRPSLVRLYDQVEARHVLAQPDFDGLLLFLVTEGSEQVAVTSHRWQQEQAARHGATSLGPDPVLAWEDRRFDFSAVERALATPGGFAETIEVAHTWSDIAALYTAMTHALKPLADQVFGHFSHIYPQGTSLYVIVFGTADDDRAAVERLRKIWEVAMSVALREGAVLSHHHGAGLARLPYMAAALGGGLGVLQRVKRALDPDGILNPGKLGLVDGDDA